MKIIKDYWSYQDEEDEVYTGYEVLTSYENAWFLYPKFKQNLFSKHMRYEII